MPERADGQLSMFPLLRPEADRAEVDLQGMVVSSRVHTVLRLAHPMEEGKDTARIEIHPHEGRWMWSTAFCIDGHGGSGYRVGPRWGKFAASMEDAILWAVHELQANVSQYSQSRQRDDIQRWLGLYAPVERDQLSLGMFDIPLVGLVSEGS
jgi:hypothetical protein